MRIVDPDRPTRLGTHLGLAYAVYEPASEPAWARMVVLHGADSQKESHYAWARACRIAGMSVVVYDQRGHGDSPGPLDARVLPDVAAMAAQLEGDAPLVLRGTSMGGWLALAAGAAYDAAGVVAICPAPAQQLERGLREGRFGFPADVAALEPVLAEHPETLAAEQLGGRLLLMHAAGDESVDVQVSRDLHTAVPGSWLLEVPGGHHRSVQHDPELQAYAIRWLAKRLRPGGTPGRRSPR